jgi:hypothetical protein
MPPPPGPSNGSGHPMVPSQHISGPANPRENRSKPSVPLNPSRAPPSLPSNAFGYPMFPSQHISSLTLPKDIHSKPFGHYAPFNPLIASMPPPSSPNTATGHPMIPHQHFSSPSISRESQPKPSGRAAPLNPLNLPRSRFSTEPPLQDPQTARVTKRSYHTAHKQPYSTQEIQRRTQLYEAELRAQERARKERRDKEDYIFKHSRRREALQNGVHMTEIENSDVPREMCEYFASTSYRYGHLPSMNPDVALPSIENFIDLPADESGGGAGAGHLVNNNAFSDLRPPNDAAGPSGPVDSPHTNENETDRTLTPLFDTPTPHNVFVGADELRAITGDHLFSTLDAEQTEPGMFLKPMWDADEGCWRAPSPGSNWTQERALVEELLHYYEDVEKQEQE